VEQGESPALAAQRELGEETGVESTVSSLNYEHAFAFGHAEVIRETAFTAKSQGEIRIDPAEHVASAWFSADEAIAKVPHAGLARAIALARQPSPRPSPEGRGSLMS
jgi:8-oxo-dGTP pyrophosphatase MutT (NUDIX family)